MVRKRNGCEEGHTLPLLVVCGQIRLGLAGHRQATTDY